MPKLGIENDQLMPCPSSPNCVSSQAEDKAHFIEPIKASGSLVEVKKTLLNVLLNSVRATVTETEGNYIKAEFVSLIFRFVDDVEFLILEKGPDEVLIHVRSASRGGYSDFGVNRKRVKKIRSRFSENVVSQASQTLNLNKNSEDLARKQSQMIESVLTC